MMHPVFKQHADQADGYNPKPNRQYRWVWEYTKFSFEWTFEQSKYVEGKSLDLFKFIGGLSVGAWAVFLFVLSKATTPSAVHPQFDWLVKTVMILGLLCLIASAVLTLLVFRAAEHLYPASENLALEYADYYPTEDEASAKFCQIFSASADLERQNTTSKAILFQWALRLFCTAAVLFATSLSLAVLR